MPTPYQGATVSDRFKLLWRFGGAIGVPGTARLGRFYGGEAKAQVHVYIRRGKLVRRYHPHGIDGDYGQPGGKQGLPFWYPDWTPDDGASWEEVPGIKEVRLTQDFASNGIQTASIDVDNVVMEETNKGLGIFHLIRRGFYSPLRGYTTPGMPAADVSQNEWFLKMPNAQILVTEGYGTEVVPVFAGLIDDLDLNAKPTTITVTSRDFGGILVDEHFFGWAQDRQVEQVTFVPRDELDNLQKVGGGASASSEREGYSARDVTRLGAEAHWESLAHDDADEVEWIEIRLPQGKYTAIYLNPAFPGMDLYVGFYVKPIDRGDGTTYHAHWTPSDGSEVALTESDLIVDGYDDNGVPQGFWTQHRGLVKADDPNGAWPWIQQIPAAGAIGQRVHLGGTLYTGNDSILRVGLRKLARRPLNGRTFYRAGMTRLMAYQKQPTPPDQDNSDLIPIDDIADIAKILFRWAGFKEWEVESSGQLLLDRIVCNTGDTLMTLLAQLRDQLGYTFFMAEPSSAESLGRPVFRYSRLFENTQSEVERVTQADLLTQAKVKWTNQPERYIIRIRGALLAAGKGGSTLSTDNAYRAMYVYRPPWHDRMAGVIKHLTQYNDAMTTVTDCRFGCYLVAIQIALAMVTAILEVPGTPHIGLDSFVGVNDDQVGLNGRLYVTNRSSTLTTGENGQWTMQLGGAVVDTPDIAVIVAQYEAALASLDRNDR